MKEIKVTKELLQKLFKVYDAMKLFQEIEPWDNDMAAHVFFNILEKVYDDTRDSKNKNK